MEKHTGRGAWLLLAAGDERGHGGNFGYDDQFDAYYSWDSNVPNHKTIAIGDLIAVWDMHQLLGASVIENIERSHATKSLSRCPECRTTRISPPGPRRLAFRCMKCKSEFPLPAPDVVEVVKYVARYDAAWTSLEGVLTAQQLRELAVNPREFNSMRALNWPAFQASLTEKRHYLALDRIATRAPDLSWPGPGLPTVETQSGHTKALVRVRRGQQDFRVNTLLRQGSVCAFTGTAPERALEAGHLYSYAELGTHFEHGGLMLRRDIHTLFDDGLLAIDPTRLHISVDEQLRAYPQYARLDGERLTVPLVEAQVDWLEKHWNEHRSNTARNGR